MGNMFGKEIPLKDLIKENKRVINRAIRELDRERTRMEREEKKLIADIKKMASQGQMKAVNIQAKELVRTRNYITKFLQMRAHLNAVQLKIQTVKSHEAMASALKGTTAAMVKMNKQMNLPAMQKIMMEFQSEEMKAEMTMELMGDTMDEAMEGENDEEEENAIVSQILDEIGINTSEMAPDAPIGVMPNQQANTAGAAEEASPQPIGVDPAVSELEERLNNLRKT
jgi:charged multivesicular body protein 2A